MSISGHTFHAGSTGITLKTEDAQMLSRSEIQYDLLQCLFDDDNDVFTNHAPFYENAERQPVYQRLTFRSLYCQALLRSEKLTGTVRKVITENEDFALEYAKVALLVNVGRLDTTTGFFIDMKTGNKAYNPIPSLQRTEGNLQDVPRIKNTLNGTYLTIDNSQTRTSLQDLQTQTDVRGPPSCGITRLLYMLASGSVPAGIVDRRPWTFVQLFLPSTINVASRARVILWFIFHYMEGAAVPNPFSDPRDPEHPPPLFPASANEVANGDRDSEAELEWGKVQSMRRTQFTANLTAQERAHEAQLLAQAQVQASSVQPVNPPAPKRRKRKGAQEQAMITADALADTQRRARAQAYVREPIWATTGKAPVQRVHIPYPPQQTMLQYAFESNRLTDPLAISDGEDETINTRWDSDRRVAVLTRLRGRPPSPSMMHEYPSRH